MRSSTTPRDAYARLAHERAVAGEAERRTGARADRVSRPACSTERCASGSSTALSRTPLLVRAAAAAEDARDDGVGSTRPLGRDNRTLVAPSRAVMLAGTGRTRRRCGRGAGSSDRGLVVVPAGREAQARVLGVEARGLADVVEELPAVERRRLGALYDALAPLADDARDREALGALPVPLADGRVVRGARGLVVLDAEVADAVGDDALRDLGRWGLRVVDPRAAHPLLARLGADTPDARGLLQHPALRAAVLEQADDDDLQLADEVTDAVLAVVRAVVGEAHPRDAAGAVADSAAWLGLVTLPAADGEPTPAHGLVLPGGAASALLDARVLAPVTLEAVERWGPTTLVAAGVRDDLAITRLTDVVAEPASVDPDGTDDESLAAQSLDGWQDYLEHLRVALGAGEFVGDAVAVADLDAVDPDSWHELLTRLATEPGLRRALLEPVRGERGSTAPSYTAWWLRERGPTELGGIFAADAGPADDASGTGKRPGAEDAAGAALRAVLPGPPEVLRGLDTAVQVALGGIAGLDDLGPGAWARLLDALGPAGTPVAPATAVALWRGISATADRLGEARPARSRTARTGSQRSSRQGGSRWCTPRTLPSLTSRCGGSAPTSRRSCRRLPRVRRLWRGCSTSRRSATSPPGRWTDQTKGLSLRCRPR